MLEINKTTEMDLVLMNFAINGIPDSYCCMKTENPEVVNRRLSSDLGANSQPSNQENEMNPERLSILHRSQFNTNISSHQQILNNIQSHISHGCEIGTGRIPFDDKRTSNIVHNITMEIDKPRIFQTFNRNHVPCTNPLNMRNSQGLLRNFESKNTAPRIDISSIPRNDLVPSNMEMLNTVHIHNMKRNLSNYSMVTDNFQAHKRTRCEVLSGKINVATFSEIGGMNYNLKSEKCVTSRMALEHNHSAVIDHEFPNITESTSNNQGMQTFGDVGKHTFFTVGQNIASDISISKISQNDNLPRMSLDSVASKRESVCILDEGLAVSGTSGYHKNGNSKNCFGKMFQYFHNDEILSIKGKEVNMLTCNVCKAEIAKHAVEYDGKNVYECCICTYYDYDQVNLQKHSSNHLPEKFCNICEKEHTEGDSHDGEKTCFVCDKKFQCRTRLNEHFLYHYDYFKEHCWGCSKCFLDHFNKEEMEKPYVCCFCPYKSKYKINLQSHKNIHRPKIFCKICREEYPIEERSSHSNEYKCIACKEEFKCKGRLEEHSKQHDAHFYNHCRVCNKEISYHKIKSEKGSFYKCCQCLKTFSSKYQLLSNLYTCSNLRLFKCGLCGIRFALDKSLNGHSGTCPAVPYKCEICKARFPRSDFLNLHCSVKHSKA